MNDSSMPIQEPEDMEAAIHTVDDTMQYFLSAGSVDAVYGVPVQQGDQMIIPAAEVLSIAGFGVGSGYGSSGDSEDQGGGSGGGGGGRVFSRPVAVIIAGPEGVRVKPVLDVTKVVLAWITALGFMLAMVARMRSGKIDD